MKAAKTLALLLLAVLLFAACSSDDEGSSKSKTSEETVIMFFPYSGLYSYLIQNIAAYEKAIVANGGTDGKRLLVFISSTSEKARLVEIVYNNGSCARDTLKTYLYTTPDYTTADGIATIIGDATAAAPALNYSLIIGSHGMAWVPTPSSSYKAPHRKALGEAELEALARQKAEKLGGEYVGELPTRWFGHSSDATYMANVESLADALSSLGIKMRYILFDACYMANIETAYALRNVTDYLIASTCEIMSDGMPYATIGKNLFDHNYKAVCQGFYTYYTVDFYNGAYPYGTISVTDCSEVEAMADIMLRINTAYPDGLASVSSVQDLDGLTPTVFFDFGNYVSTLCTDEALLAEFTSQLERLVPYENHTSKYYSGFTKTSYKINTFSGLTISDPTTNNYSSYGYPATMKSQTEWYKATH